MDTAWVGVVGTSIGALIGAIVTIWTATLRSRQDERQQIRAAAREDRLRREDRVRARAEQNLEQRRALYSRMLKSANEAWAAARYRYDRATVLPKGARSKAGETEAREQGAIAVQELTNAVAEVELVAPSRELVQHALLVQNDAARLVPASMPLREQGETEYRQNLDKHMAAFWNHLQTLREAVRLDLGLDHDLTQDRLLPPVRPFDRPPARPAAETNTGKTGTPTDSNAGKE